MKKLPRILLKTLLILLVIFALWQFTQSLGSIGKLSLYNGLFPGRERLPFGESPRTAYNFSLNELNAMFASHKISAAGEKGTETLRAVVIGDSSSWGTLLKPEETLAGKLDGQLIPGTQTKLECYNLAYPTLSLSKDLLLMNRSLEFDPDLIIWPLTLESFPKDKQLSTALVSNNPEEFNTLAEKSALSYQVPNEESFISRSLFGQRRELADLIRLQLYGVMWAGTGIDQDYTQEYKAPQLDLEADNTFHEVEGEYPEDDLAWDVLEAGISMAGDVPILVINEPMLISDGANSDIRYNFYYPREAYDAWHEKLIDNAAQNGWVLLDLWNVLPQEAFTNSAIHYDAEGAETIAEMILNETGLMPFEEENE